MGLAQDGYDGRIFRTSVTFFSVVEAEAVVGGAVCCV